MWRPSSSTVASAGNYNSSPNVDDKSKGKKKAANARMSSLAAARADNYYVPNNEPFVKNKKNLLKKKKRKRSANNTNSEDSNAVGSTIRFAMPYSGTCLQCGHFFSQGTRFYARKVECGRYLEKIPIFRFSNFNCNSCRNEFIVETDPKNSSYVYKTGCKARGGSIPNIFPSTNGSSIQSESRNEVICTSKDQKFIYVRKSETNNHNDDNNIAKSTQGKIVDPIKELEMIKKDHDRDQRIKDIYTFNRNTQYEDYNMNSKLRKENRKKRRKEQKLVKKAILLGLGDSSVRLLPYHKTDKIQAANEMKNKNNNNLKQRKKKVIKINKSKMRKRLLRDASIF